MRPMRSWLFTPGNDTRKIRKAFKSEADVIVLDLEDAVAIEQKTATRKNIVNELNLTQQNACLLYVRINATETEYCYKDLCEIIGPWLDGILLPKVENASQIEKIDWLTEQLEKEKGLRPGALDIMPIIETGTGLMSAKYIANSKTRVKRLSFGAGDFTNDMGMTWTPNEEELRYARSVICLESRAAGLELPIDSVFIDLNDHKHMKNSAMTASGLGFQGKFCIHPKQINTINQSFTPTKEELDHAKKIVSAFKQAESDGLAAIQIDGYFIDYPVAERAQRTLTSMNDIIKQKNNRNTEEE